MELQWIDDFLALCQTRNFTRAAEARCTTQSAYSRRMRRLEEWLGAPLFYRERRPVDLTPAGEQFLTRAHRLREDIFDARRAVLSASSHFKKSLRIYTTNTLAASFLSTWLAENKLENYSLIVASISGCLEAVRRGHADMGLIPHFGGDEALAGLTTLEIGRDRLMLVARRDAAAPGGLGPEETARPRDGLYARHDIWRANRRHAGASSNPNSGVAGLRERLGGGFARASQGGTGIGVDSRNSFAGRRDETMHGAGFL